MKTLFKSLAYVRLLIFTTRMNYYMDILQQSAVAWKEIFNYRYLFTYGYRKQLYPITLTFSMEDYPHLAGFQYTKDISLPNYSSAKIADRILEGKISFDKIQKADYLISSHFNIDNFIFIIKANSQNELKCDFLCCSIFEKGNRNYEANQRSLALLKKERIYIPTNTTDILFNKLT